MNNHNPLINAAAMHRAHGVSSTDDASSSFIAEAESILLSYADACMRNAMFTISRTHPDISGLLFGVRVDNAKQSIMIFPNEDLPIEMIGSLEDSINAFASRMMDKETIIKAFDGTRINYSGVISMASKKQSLSM